MNFSRLRRLGRRVAQSDQAPSVVCTQVPGSNFPPGQPSFHPSSVGDLVPDSSQIDKTLCTIDWTPKVIVQAKHTLNFPPRHSVEVECLTHPKQGWLMLYIFEGTFASCLYVQLSCRNQTCEVRWIRVLAKVDKKTFVDVMQTFLCCISIKKQFPCVEVIGGLKSLCELLLSTVACP